MPGSSDGSSNEYREKLMDYPLINYSPRCTRLVHFPLEISQYIRRVATFPPERAARNPLQVRERNMASRNVDYSLYLVTDSTSAILGDKDLVSVVKAAVEDGVTIVQLRDKTAETGELVRVAKALHKVTRAAGVPLLINDRVDVALAAGVEGVHIGQDDLDLKTARLILGQNAIIGVTANSEKEAIDAARDGADYLGIGTVFATPTKENTKSIIGTAGVQRILAALTESDLGHVKTVCIGGINGRNAQRVLYQTAAPQKKLDGIAIVSAIMAAEEPKSAASSLRELIASPAPFAASPSKRNLTQEAMLAKVSSTIKHMAEKKPLCHNMTNLVVQNFAANVALAIGSSPIMSNNGLEAADLAALGGSLVINMGTTTPDVRSNHLQALAAYNAVGGPTLLDPVGAGATQQRRDGVKALMAGGYFDVMKGNEGEIRTIFGSTGVKQHGVDSGASQLSRDEKITLVKVTAAREHNIVLMTGSEDVLSDGEQTIIIKNGHKLLGEITGSGCSLGTTIASVLAVERENKLLAALSAILMYEIAAERAARRAEVRGPGTFIPAFIDELFLIRQESLQEDDRWVGEASVEFV
nr:putative thiamine biosynthetic bifunctional enzyme [Quercus suber]